MTIKKIHPFLLEDLLSLYKAVSENIENGVIQHQYIADELEAVSSDIASIKERQNKGLYPTTDVDTIFYFINNNKQI